MTVREAIERAGEALAGAATPGARIFLFGSHARGEGTPDSDLDFLVIEDEVSSRLREMVRLRRAIPPVGLPIDVVVVTQEQATKWKDVPGTVVHSALNEGRRIDRE